MSARHSVCVVYMSMPGIVGVFGLLVGCIVIYLRYRDQLRMIFEAKTRIAKNEGMIPILEKSISEELNFLEIEKQTMSEIDPKKDIQSDYDKVEISVMNFLDDMASDIYNSAKSIIGGTLFVGGILGILDGNHYTGEMAKSAGEKIYSSKSSKPRKKLWTSKRQSLGSSISSRQQRIYSLHSKILELKDCIKNDLNFVSNSEKNPKGTLNRKLLFLLCVALSLAALSTYLATTKC